ncbi:SDR family NAD(P)-dependent oxidoreductase [Streptomyces sp. NPDC059340]|uniref:SDR family NAD(P)-dependent oxidoreductase n=1 Tax=Streptomyces sp. NPDC059340 TaxID=3346806 RepID=UPI0036B9C82E
MNYLGTWAVSRAFAPVLAANGGGALVNMPSVASWRVNKRWPSYAASKAAEWSLTNALRVGQRQQGTLVVGVHVGLVDTDATMGLDAPKVPAAEVAAQTMDAISRDVPEVLVDEVSRRVRAALSGSVELLDPAP